MTVLVTGAAGFISSHIVDLLLSKGHQVIGTSRSKSKGDEIVELFKEKYPHAKLSFAVVKDITVDGAFDEVLKSNPDITQVFHTATGIGNFGVGPELFEKEFLAPAVHGTLSVLNSIYSVAPQVENVVITSSAAAVIPRPLEESPESTLTSKVWNSMGKEDIGDSSFNAYIVAKTLAEKASVKFIEEKKPNFTLTAINPFFVFGPQVFDEMAKGSVNGTNEMLLAMIKKPSDDYEPTTNTYSVDVRDVAKYHIIAMEDSKRLNGQRILLGPQRVTDQICIDALHKALPDIDYKIKGFAQEYKSITKVDNEETVAQAGFKYEFIPIEKTIGDTINQYTRVNGNLF